MNKIAAPEPGLYPGSPFETYASWNAVNHGKLKRMAKTPAHFLYEEDTDSETKIIGRAGHLCLLELDAFMAKAGQAPINPRTQEAFGYATKAYQEAAAENPDKILLSGSDFEMCLRIRQAVYDHPAARDVLSYPGMSEVSAVWHDKSGFTCKMRGDRVNEFYWIDFKTAEDASSGAFASAVARYGYATSQAFYARGRAALAAIPGHSALASAAPIMIIAEKTPLGPLGYAIAVREIGPQTMQAAEVIVSQWLEKAKACQAAGIWPAYADTIETVEAPEWFFRGFADGD